MTFYETFKKSGAFIDETDFVKIYECVYREDKYYIIIPRRYATKNTVIHCVDNNIYWEQIPVIPRLAGRWDGDRIPIYKFNGKGKAVFAVKGRPNTFIGLDEGIFCSANNFNKSRVNVMSFSRFKKLEIACSLL